MKKINSNYLIASILLHILLMIGLGSCIVVTDECWFASAGVIVLLITLITITNLAKLGTAIEKHNKKVCKMKNK